ncbi:carbamoyltransferase HypF [Pseudomonadota bacterium]
MRWQIDYSGVVQGVGFRPTLYRLARELNLSGEISNHPRGVRADLEGNTKSLRLFLKRVPNEIPATARIDECSHAVEADKTFHQLSIVESNTQGPSSAEVLADTATCPQCAAELFNPADRRYLYPFISCAECGPRYSILHRPPFDRMRTTMDIFPMCEECQLEYDNPDDRRFHAQTISCPICGPHLEYLDNQGRLLSLNEKAVSATSNAIDSGLIVAVKGLGGYHLICDASNDTAVENLRMRKSRPHKPFAIMANWQEIQSLCVVNSAAERLLKSPQSPVVLLKQRLDADTSVSAMVAPDNPYLGIMLPYTPLHKILCIKVAKPLLATSANISGEPICTSKRQVIEKLSAVADQVLTHDRGILRPLDDSVCQIVAGNTQLLRRARGYAATAIKIKGMPAGLLAVGGQLKNTVALTGNDKVYLSPHIGDLQNYESIQQFERSIRDLATLFSIEPEQLISDQHPDYYSSHFAFNSRLPRTAIQHHEAHLAACCLEHQIEEPALAIIWDGSGYHASGTIRGGEFLTGENHKWEGCAQLRTFKLPGGEAAVREPRRSAYSVLHQLSLIEKSMRWVTEASFNKSERANLRRMLEQDLNSPLTSSMGRLFDIVASLTGLVQTSSFEGQAAMAVQFSAEAGDTDKHYEFHIEPGITMYTVDWAPCVEELTKDVASKQSIPYITRKFHNGLAQLLVDMVALTNVTAVLMSGGCFQNRLLLELCINRCKQIGITPYWNQQIPTNDGGLAFGQIAAYFEKNGNTKICV